MVFLIIVPGKCKLLSKSKACYILQGRSDSMQQRSWERNWGCQLQNILPWSVFCLRLPFSFSFCYIGSSYSAGVTEGTVLCIISM